MSLIIRVLNDVWLWVLSIKLAEWIGIAGFSLALHTHFHKRGQAKREAHRNEVLSIIARLRTLCDEASDEIVRHLCFHPTRKTKEEIYRILNSAKRELASLESRLQSMKAEILKAYAEWYSVVTGDGFPVEKKTSCFKSTDDRVRMTIAAQNTLSEHLDKLRIGCLSEKIRYWP